MKIKKLLVAGLLATVGFSSVVSAAPLFKATTQQAQLYAQDNDIKGVIGGGASISRLDNYCGSVDTGTYTPTYGNKVIVEAELFNHKRDKAEVDITIFLDNHYYQTYTLNKNNSSLFLPLTINEPTQIKVIETVKKSGKNAMLTSKVYQPIKDWSQFEKDSLEDKKDRPALILADSVRNTSIRESVFDVDITYGKQVGITVDRFGTAQMDIHIYVNDELYDTIKLDKDTDLVSLPFITLEESSQIRIEEKVRGGKIEAISYFIQQC